MHCPTCGGRDHALCKPSKMFAPTLVSIEATPSKDSSYWGEARFEREVATKDRGAYKDMRDAGLQPERLTGSHAEMVRRERNVPERSRESKLIRSVGRAIGDREWAQRG